MGAGGAEYILIRPISYLEILDSPHAEALLKEYSEECSIPEIGVPDPQRAMYATMESAGLMHSWGAFDGDELVGFATLLIFILPHYGKKIATVESLFLAKSHRHGSAGRSLMAVIEAWAKEARCVGMLYNARAGSSLERLLNSLPNYQRTNSVFLWSVA